MKEVVHIFHVFLMIIKVALHTKVGHACIVVCFQGEVIESKKGEDILYLMKTSALPPSLSCFPVNH